MQRNGWIVGVGLLWLMLPECVTYGQQLVTRSGLLRDLGTLCDTGSSNYYLRFSPTLTYSLNSSFSKLVNPLPGAMADHLFLTHELRCNAMAEDPGMIRITATLFHQLGLQSFFDSITRLQSDESSLTTRIDFHLFRKISINISLSCTTRLFNQYEEVDSDSGHVKRLTTGFLSPLFCLFSAGMCFPLAGYGKVIVGIPAVRLTFIGNHDVFIVGREESRFGVPPSRSTAFEYGLSLEVGIERRLARRLAWTFDLRLFKDTRNPVDLRLQNNLSVNITRYLKGALQTRIFYQESVSKAMRMENLLSLGFCINL